MHIIQSRALSGVKLCNRGAHCKHGTHWRMCQSYALPPASLVTGFYDPRNGELQIDSWNIAKSYGTTTTLGPWAEA